MNTALKQAFSKPNPYVHTHDQMVHLMNNYLVEDKENIDPNIVPTKKMISQKSMTQKCDRVLSFEQKTREPFMPLSVRMIR